MKMRPLLIVCMIASGLIPMGLSSVIISQQASSTVSEQTMERMSGDVELRKSFVENYVNTLVGQTEILGQMGSVRVAMKNFSSSFNDFGENSNGTNRSQQPSIRDMKTALQRYYDRELLPRLKANGGSASNQQLLPRTDAGVVAQYEYLIKNPNPAGQKEDLETHGTDDAYGRNHAEHHNMFRSYLRELGLYDIFLIEPEQGTIVYSVYKETDYGTSLFNGPYRDSNLATAARKAMSLGPGETLMQDFEHYVPSAYAPAAFIATPIYSQSKMIGVLAFQMPIDKLNAEMQLQNDLTETKESMLVGEDLLMRSQSRFTDENTIISQQIESDGVQLAFEGKSGSMHEVSDGVEYVTAYAKLDLDHLDWVIITREQNLEAMASITNIIKTTLIVAGCSAVVVALFAMFLGNHLFRVLGGDPQDMERVAKLIADGDLSDHPEDVNRVGAYGQLIDMRKKLRDILQEAKSISHNVRAGANELSDGNRGLSERTEQQASNLEETGSSTEELTSTVKQNAENARSANDLAISTRERAVSSGEVAGRAITAMQEISSASERIADIIGVIDEIAFQTNLLALNAAVEAARAGEQGRGFAVVASEVRQLAGRSASAAKEIKELIEDSVIKVKDGTGLVTESGDELKTIVGSVSKLTEIVGQIAVATDEQAVGIEQINQALVHMDSVTQQNAALVEQAATTSRTMSDQSSLLTASIGYFKSDGGPRTEQPAPRVAEAPSALAKALPWQSKKANNAPTASAANQVMQSPIPEPVKKAVGSDDMWDEF